MRISQELAFPAGAAVGPGFSSDVFVVFCLGKKKKLTLSSFRLLGLLVACSDLKLRVVIYFLIFFKDT